MEHHFVYIASNAARTVLYVGIAKNLFRRMWEHRHGLMEGFTTRYRVTRLVYCETLPDARMAAARERQLKGWTRSKKLELIRSQNPNLRDLFLLLHI